VVTAPIGHIQLAPLTVLGARGDATELAVLPSPSPTERSHHWTGPPTTADLGLRTSTGKDYLGLHTSTSNSSKTFARAAQCSRLLRRRRATPKYPECFQHALTDPAVSRFQRFEQRAHRSPAVACLTWRYRHRGCHKTAGPEVGLWTATVLRGLSTYPRHQLPSL